MSPSVPAAPGQPGPARPPRPSRAGSSPVSPPASRPDAIERPHPSRFDPASPGYGAALAAHAAADGDAGYLDPASGLFVLTAAYLLARGSCCDNGCRHCPYVGATTPAVRSGR